jgi:hypothetical protein
MNSYKTSSHRAPSSIAMNSTVVVSADGLRRAVFRTKKVALGNRTYGSVRIAHLYARLDGRWVLIPGGSDRDPQVAENYIANNA